jgi:hypothetical protein
VCAVALDTCPAAAGALLLLMLGGETLARRLRATEMSGLCLSHLPYDTISALAYRAPLIACLSHSHAIRPIVRSRVVIARTIRRPRLIVRVKLNAYDKAR